MKVNIQMFRSWFGYTALLQLQTAHRYDDRAGDFTRPKQITVHSQILGGMACLSELRAPVALPKHPSHGKNSMDVLFQVRDEGRKGR